MCRLISSLFLLWAIINSGHSINQPVFELDEANSTKEADTGIEKYGESGGRELLSHQLWPAAAALFLTSVLAASFTALKIFVAQTLLVSKLSLAGAALLAAKAAYDHLKHKFQNGGHPAGDSNQELLVAAPWAWEPVMVGVGAHDAQGVRDLPLIADEERGVVPEEAVDPYASVRSDRMKQRYRPDLSAEYETIIKKTTYLE